MRPLRSRARKILQDIAAAGHVVGNHTVHHRVLPSLTPEQVAYEIDHNADLIHEVLGERELREACRRAGGAEAIGEGSHVGIVVDTRREGDATARVV